MTESKDLNHQVRRASYMTVALVAGLIFGIILLFDGDWVPGGVIVVAALVVLALHILTVAKLRKRGPLPPPMSKPTS